MGRGISRIYDVALACAVLLAGCSLAVAAVQPHADNGADDLSALALHTLAYLDRQHVLGRIFYSGDSECRPVHNRWPAAGASGIQD
jgi:hypothetical protein